MTTSTLAVDPDVAQVLETIGPFRKLPRRATKRLLQNAQLRQFAVGQYLMRQDEPSDCLHVILDGMVCVERTHFDLVEPLVLGELGAGEVVGEMGVLDEAPRSASVVALVPTQTLRLDADILREIVNTYPKVSEALLRLLSQRLRSTSELAEYYLRRSHGA